MKNRILEVVKPSLHRRVYDGIVDFNHRANAKNVFQHGVCCRFV